jgi:DNA-binding NarL/FixJ family response regulator
MAIRILLADDNDQFRAVIGQFLSKEATNLQVVGSVGDSNAAVQ